MSDNCRVNALDVIFEKVDRLDDDHNVPDNLKKLNDSVFAEMAKARYMKDHGVDEDDDALKNIDDFHYRYIYYDERQHVQTKNVLREFGSTKEYLLANLRFDFTRNMVMDVMEDNFRCDRFGNVLPQDIHKRQKWDILIKDMANADSKKLLKIHKKFYTRVAGLEVNTSWCSEKGYKKDIINAKRFIYSVTSLENLTTDFKSYNNDDAIISKIREWNADHPEDKIPEEMIKKVRISTDNYDELIKSRSLYEKLPSLAKRKEFIDELNFKFEQGLRNAKGITLKNPLEFHVSIVMDSLYNYKKFVRNPKEKCPYSRDVDLEYLLIHRNGEEFDYDNDVDEEENLVHDPQNPLMYIYEQCQPKTIQLAERLYKTGYLKGADKHGDSLERVDRRITLFTKAEDDAMKRFDDIIGDKGDKAERAAINKLYKDYIAELELQAVAIETMFLTDMNYIEGDVSVYYQEVLKYCEGRKKIDKLFDELENAREEFLIKNAGEQAYNTWKKELEDARSRSREEIQKLENENTTALERVEKAFVVFKATREVDRFSKDEYEEVKKNNVEHGHWGDQQKDRVLEAFILPVHRDFSGAYLTEFDKYKADFNRRYKHAMMQGNEDQIRDLSREFVEKVIPQVKLFDPEGIDELSPEVVEEKYINSGVIDFRFIKLNYMSDANGGVNSNYPLLKTGIDELKAKDPDKYRKTRKKLSLCDSQAVEFYMNSIGFNTDNAIHDIPKRGRSGFRAAYENQFKMYKDSYMQE